MTTSPSAASPSVETIQRVPGRRRVVLFGFGLPLLAVVIGLALMVSWLPHLPNPVATHWSGGAHPDGFGNAATYLVMLPATVIPFSVLMTVMAWHYAHSGQGGVYPRMLVAFSVLFSGFLAVTLTASLGTQQGLTEATDATDPGTFFAVGVVTGAVLAAAVWFLIPHTTVVPRPALREAELPHADSTGDSRREWTRTTSVSFWVACLVVIVIPLVAILFAVTRGGASAAPVVIVAVVVVLAGLTMFHWRATVDQDGLTIRSVIGVPRFRVPIANVVQARVVTVGAIREFGGWGIRLSPDGRIGVILRSGEALEVTREHGRPIVITIEDAETAAGLLNALKKRTASH